MWKTHWDKPPRPKIASATCLPLMNIKKPVSGNKMKQFMSAFQNIVIRHWSDTMQLWLIRWKCSGDFDLWQAGALLKLESIWGFICEQYQKYHHGPLICFSDSETNWVFSERDFLINVFSERVSVLLGAIWKLLASLPGCLNEVITFGRSGKMRKSLWKLTKTETWQTALFGDLTVFFQTTGIR